MRVIGTAGHVDHGKSTLVEALTGTHPDRLKEEKEREMTIDLGFAWLTLPGGEEIGIVDVPGHRDFIENMLSGVGGIDAALFVVAADEGVMPQTREHLAILDLLQIGGGVIALTKIDLVDEPDWLDLIEADLRATLAHTVLANAPIVRVSARTRSGLDTLLTALQVCLADRPLRSDFGRPRLPVDRVFSVAGFGSVVTGTLTDGYLQVGDEVEVLPAGLRGRVRGLQTHKKKETVAVPGSRTAVNISGVTLDEVQRGAVITHPGDYLTTRRLDVRFRLLPGTSGSVVHNMQVKLFIGAAEVLCRLRLLGSEELLPGQEGWLQLELVEPVVAIRGDRYILRRPSPSETLGGGSVVDPAPRGRHRRFSQETLDSLAALSRGTPADLLTQAVQALGVGQLKDVFQRANLEPNIADQTLKDLLANGSVIILEGDETSAPRVESNTLLTSRTFWSALAQRMRAEVETYHRTHPLRMGMPREELKSRLAQYSPKESARIQVRLFNAVLRHLVTAGDLLESGPMVLQPGHAIHFTPAQQGRIDGLLRKFAAAPFAPPSPKECQAELGEEIYAALLDLNTLVQVAPDVVFQRSDYEHMVAEVQRLIQLHGTLSAAQVRDHFNTSRKYVLGLLEYLDANGITIRDGDVRRLKA